MFAQTATVSYICKGYRDSPHLSGFFHSMLGLCIQDTTCPVARKSSADVDLKAS